MKEADIKPGAVYRYVGKSHGMANGLVKVIGPILDDEGRPTGRYDVQPWLAKEGRYSWVTCDAAADELAPAPEAPQAALEGNDPTVTEWTIDPTAPGYKRLFGDRET